MLDLMILALGKRMILVTKVELDESKAIKTILDMDKPSFSLDPRCFKCTKYQ